MSAFAWLICGVMVAEAAVITWVDGKLAALGAATLTTERDGLRCEIVRMQVQRDDARQRCDEARVERNNAVSQLAATRAELDNAQAEVGRLRDKLRRFDRRQGVGGRFVGVAQG